MLKMSVDNGHVSRPASLQPISIYGYVVNTIISIFQQIRTFSLFGLSGHKQSDREQRIR